MTDALTILKDGLDAVPGDLPADAPDTDRSDVAIQERTQQHIDRDNLEWLVNVEDDDFIMFGSTGEGEKSAPDTSFLEIRDDELPSDGDPDETPLWQRVAGDVGRGIVEAPGQVAGGLLDAAQAVLDLGGILDEKFPVGGPRLFDKDWNFNPGWHSPEDVKADPPKIPTTPEAESTTGSGIRVIAQFIAPYAKASQGLKAAGFLGNAGKVGTGGRALTAGAIADFAAFDGHDKRLSDLLREWPGLRDPVTAYLASDEDDPELEGRLKNAIEGLALGGVAAGLGEVLFRALGVFRKKLKLNGSSAIRQGEAVKSTPVEELVRPSGDLDFVKQASEDAPLFTTKLKQAGAETNTGVPDDVAAHALHPEKGLSEIGENTDVFVNFARINTPDDIQRVIQDTASAFSKEVDEARRGVRSNIETRASSQDIDAWELLMSRRQGETLNAEQSLAARELWVSSGNALGELAKRASEAPTPENLFQFRRMLATHHAIQKEVIAARTETARALQQWRMPAGGNSEILRDIDQALNVAGGLGVSRELADRIAILARSGNTVGLTNFVEKSVFAKSFDSIHEYWINSILSGPKTHLVNAISNTSVIGLSLIERNAAARIGQLTGNTDGVVAGEVLSQVHGLMTGIGDAFRNAGKTLRTGQTGFGVNKIEAGRTRAISSTNWNLRSESWYGRAVDTLGAVVNVPGRGLQTADEFFKTMGYRSELHAQAYRQAARELEAGNIAREDFKSRLADIIADPPESIRMEAAYTAAYQTFTNEPGAFTRKIMALRSEYPVLGYIVPFVNTPGKILNYTFERTPIAPLTRRYRAAIAEGGAKADLARSRMALGTATTLYAIDLGMRGHLTGSGPEKPSEKQNWRRQGFQPYSVKIGDNWVAFNRVDPLGYLFGIGGDIAEFTNNAEFDENTGAELQEAMAAVVFSVAENATSKSYMQGVSLLLEAVNDPKRFAPSYLERFASSFIPSGVSEVARFKDPVLRASHDIITAMKRRTPGYTEDLPARRDLWGREIRYESGLGKAYDAASPLYVSQFKPQPIDEAMQRDGYFIGMPSKTFTIDGEAIGLRNDPDIYNRYVLLQGGTRPSQMGADGLADRYGDRTLLEVLNDIVTGKDDLSEPYDEAMDPAEKRDIIQGVVRRYRRAARRVIFDEYPELEARAGRKKASRIERSQ
ncbi:hypothetical protein [Hoeflea sp. TYP-13]|uniref:hypothetical protein n=1 Tax=Hoeflea sp. TYP-13 TaxID=3230023 RepID=UPI0034C6315B